jgi:hypothetical protein
MSELPLSVQRDAETALLAIADIIARDEKRDPRPQPLTLSTLAVARQMLAERWGSP